VIAAKFGLVVCTVSSARKPPSEQDVAADREETKNVHVLDVAVPHTRDRYPEYHEEQNGLLDLSDRALKFKRKR
jgi:CRISPR/Cas system CMR-associated protein Cmr3 (group 5 of RAMP superfamily)